MYWYRSKALIPLVLSGGLFLITVLPACKPAIKENGAALKYFDLKGYFERDSARLTKLNPPVFKTVTQNKVSESKKVYIANWGAELSMFKASDINKPAWNDSYTVQTGDGVTIYMAKDSALETREIMIRQVNGKLKWLFIYNHTKNKLYESSEMLSYFPDSLYQVSKKQSIIFLGTNFYRVKGLFN